MTIRRNIFNDAPFDGTGYVREDGTWSNTPTFIGQTYLVPVWAEENAALTSAGASYQWAFGNGANTPSTNGLIIHVPANETCEIVAIGLVSSAAITATVEAVLNGTPQGASCQIALAAAASGKTTLGTPVSVSDGDILNFRTQAGNAGNTGTPNQAILWLLYTVTS